MTLLLDESDDDAVKQLGDLFDDEWGMMALLMEACGTGKVNIKGEMSAGQNASVCMARLQDCKVRGRA